MLQGPPKNTPTASPCHLAWEGDGFYFSHQEEKDNISLQAQEETKLRCFFFNLKIPVGGLACSLECCRLGNKAGSEGSGLPGHT